jgi:hypothetical protein
VTLTVECRLLKMLKQYEWKYYGIKILVTSAKWFFTKDKQWKLIKTDNKSWWIRLHIMINYQELMTTVPDHLSGHQYFSTLSIIRAPVIDYLFIYLLGHQEDYSQKILRLKIHLSKFITPKLALTKKCKLAISFCQKPPRKLRQCQYARKNILKISSGWRTISNFF